MSPVLTKQPEDLIVDGNSDCCPDCPDINPDLPLKSECPNFDTVNGVPVCKREGGMDARLRDFIGPTRTIGNVSLQGVDAQLISEGVEQEVQ